MRRRRRLWLLWWLCLQRLQRLGGGSRRGGTRPARAFCELRLESGDVPIGEIQLTFKLHASLLLVVPLPLER